MKNSCLNLLCLGLALAALSLEAQSGPPKRPFPRHVICAAGTIKPNHHNQALLDADVRNFYAYWKASYVLGAGAVSGLPLYRISFGSQNPARTVSEGQGYGMVIIALMAGYDPDAQKIFDGLWRFARRYPSSQNPRLMAWKVPRVPGDDDSASTAMPISPMA